MVTFQPYDHFEVITDPDDNRHWCVRRLRDGRIMAYENDVRVLCRWLRAWGPDRT